MRRPPSFIPFSLTHPPRRRSSHPLTPHTRPTSCATCPTMPPFHSPIEPTRVHHLNSVPLPSSPPSPTSPTPHVLYWLQTSLRARQSPALEHAAALAKHLRLPLRAAHTFSVVDADARALTARHAYFLVEALGELQATLRMERAVELAVVRPGPGVEDAVERLAGEGGVVVTDVDYLRKGRTDRARVGKRLASRGVGLWGVEGGVVVPVGEASAGVEYAARTIRGKINGKVDVYLRRVEAVELDAKAQGRLCGEKEWVERAGLEVMDVRDVEGAVAALDGLDLGATRVVEWVGGENAAEVLLDAFLEKKLERYAKERNEPALGMQSGLSPYLRIGAVSPVEVAMRTREMAEKDKRKGVKEGAEAFLEELIVRRELAVNMCWYGPADYDVYERTVPNYARESLALHKSDRRPKIYSYEELEAGVTSDQYWNAAQHELLVTGKMHGYMRMYWAKQIIGWTPDAETALDYCIRLNNRWQLDAVDPNSYAGIVWNFGRHDQGWKERAIWGKVRYMNDAGLKRKFNMAAYIYKVERLVKKHGLPPIVQPVVRSKPKAPGRVTTLEEVNARAAAKRGKQAKTNGDNSNKRKRKA